MGAAEVGICEPSFAELEAQGESPPGLNVIRLVDVPDTPPPPDVIADFAPARFPTSLYGAGGSAKSILALLAAISVAGDVPFLGRAVTPGPVLYLDWELDDDVTARRGRQLVRGLGLARVPEHLYYLNPLKPILAFVDELAATIEQRQVSLVVIDSLGLAICGDTQSEQGVIPAMLALRALGVASLVIDHQGHVQAGEDYAAKHQFGSVYKANLSRSQWQVDTAEPGLDRSIVELVLRQKKASFGQRQPDLGVSVSFAGPGGPIRVEQLDVGTTPALRAKGPARDRILAAVREEPGIASETLAELLSLPLKTTQNALTGLAAHGQVRLVAASRREPAAWYPTAAAKARVEYPDRDTEYPDRDQGAL